MKTKGTWGVVLAGHESRYYYTNCKLRNIPNTSGQESIKVTYASSGNRDAIGKSWGGPITWDDRHLLVTDYHSYYLEVTHLSPHTTQAVIEKLEIIFSRQGFPEQVFRNNGPQFDTEEFQDFS